MVAGGERNRPAKIREKPTKLRRQLDGDGREATERAEVAEVTAEREGATEEKPELGKKDASRRFCKFIRLCATKNRMRRAKWY